MILANQNTNKLFLHVELLSVASVGLVLVLLTLLLPITQLRLKNSNNRVQLGFRRNAIMRYVLGKENTPWRRILSFGRTCDFIVSTNFTKSIILDVLLPVSKVKQYETNFGSPFRTEPKTYGKTPILESVDLVGMVLWYLKSKEYMYRMCPIFRVVPATMSVWLNYALHLMHKVVQEKSNKCFIG